MQQLILVRPENPVATPLRDVARMMLAEHVHIVELAVTKGQPNLTQHLEPHDHPQTTAC